jgi:superfamily II DNA or RNA helicase
MQISNLMGAYALALQKVAQEVPRGQLKDSVELRPHQRDAITKLLARDGNLILSHPVGSGKTISSIAAVEALKGTGKAQRALVVVPASLRSNFADNGVKKFTTANVAVFGNKQEVSAGQGVPVTAPDPKADYHVVSYELFRENPEAYIRAAGADTVVFDELHKIKNVGATAKALRESRPLYRNFIGLTGSVVSNTPADVVPLVDAMTAGKHHLGTKENFERRFVDRSGSVPKVTNTTALRVMLNPYIHHVDPAAAGVHAPKKQVEVVKVDMTNEQRELYQYAINKMDPVTALKFRFGTSKLKTNEVNAIFHKMLQARQVANAIHTVNQSVSLSDSAQRSPKIKKVLDDVEEHLKETPDGHAIVYSNMIQGGVDVVSQGLRDRKIPFGVFIGKGQPGSTEAKRQQAVQDYKAGKVRVLVISSAGGEGLDLGNTTFVATLDGHFNPEKTLQAEARGVRAGGLAHRAPEDRNVLVRRYVTTVPLSKTQAISDAMDLVAPTQIVKRILGGQPLVYNPLKRERSPDEWAYEVAETKHGLNRALKSQFEKVACVEDMLEQAMDALSAAIPFMKEAAAKPTSKDRKEARLAAQRIPFQTQRLVKSDKPIFDSYMTEFGPKLETQVDPNAELDSEKDRLREQEYINALRSYYENAAKQESISLLPEKEDKDRYKTIAKQIGAMAALGGIYGSSAGMSEHARTMFPRPLSHYMKKAVPIGMGIGTLAGGLMSLPQFYTPGFTTSKAMSKRMAKLSDDELRQVLRGLEVTQEEKKIRRLHIGAGSAKK